MSNSLLDQALKAMNASGLTSNAFTQENKQPVVEEPVVEETVEYVNEAASKPSIAHLAADHYHHVGTGSDYNDGASSREKSAGRAKAKSTLAKVEHHYGKEAAKDVEHHTDHAFAHDNMSGPGGTEGTHKKFADKHLGGKGSAQHKEYTDRLAHHGYEIGPDTGMHTND